MNKLKGKTVIITGASSGIGRSTVFDFVKQQVKSIVLVSRNKERLSEVSSEIRGKCESMVFACDVSNKTEVLKMAKDVLSVHDVDILVNNAGIGILGDVANQSIGDMESVTKTNYFGMIYCTKAFLDPMLRKKNGHIVNVASLAASFGIPGLAAYCGSKFAMLGFSESLRHELHGTGVRVTVVSPIGVKTNFFHHPSFGNKFKSKERFYLDPISVSKAIIRACTSNRLEIVVPFYMRGGVWLKHTIPCLVDPIVGTSFRKILDIKN
jgi:short-subunit dehydrogenase